MNSFLITYDNKPPRDYQALYQLMAGLRAVRLSESVWLANLAGPASVVRDLVRNSLQQDDIVTVTELKKGADWAVSRGTSAAATAWLSNYVTPSQAAA